MADPAPLGGHRRSQRLFVAVWPSASAVAAIAESLAAVPSRHPDLRWQPPQRWHVTLAFLGQADAVRVGRAVDRLMTHPPAAEPLRTRGAGTFGPVLWLGLEHGAWLSALAARLQRGLHLPDPRFRGHVTVARGRGPRARDAAQAAVPDLEGHRGPAWTPEQVTLVSSTTGPAPSYDALRSWPLAAASAPPA